MTVICLFKVKTKITKIKWGLRSKSTIKGVEWHKLTRARTLFVLLPSSSWYAVKVLAEAISKAALNSFLPLVISLFYLPNLWKYDNFESQKVQIKRLNALRRLVFIERSLKQYSSYKECFERKLWIIFITNENKSNEILHKDFPVNFQKMCQE